jgi:hypothetical protein
MPQAFPQSNFQVFLSVQTKAAKWVASASNEELQLLTNFLTNVKN